MPGTNSGVSVLVWLSRSPGRWSLDDGVGDEAEPAVEVRTNSQSVQLHAPIEEEEPQRRWGFRKLARWTVVHAAWTTAHVYVSSAYNGICF